MKKEKKSMISIKVKLLGAICPMVALIMIALIMISYSVSKNIIQKQAVSMLESSAKNQATQIESWMSENLAAFEAAKNVIEGTNPTDVDVQNILDRFYGYNSNYPEGLYIADESGNVIQASQVEKAKTDVMNASWYQQGFSRINMAFGTAYTNESGESVISATGILNENRATSRIIAADVPINHISIIVNSFIDMENADSFLIDCKDGTILAHNDSSLISTRLGTDNADPYLRKVAEKIANREFSQCVIQDNLTAFEKVNNTDWLLVSYVSEHKIYAELYRLRNILIVIGIISIIGLLVVIERLVHFIIKPVKGLT